MNMRIINVSTDINSQRGMAVEKNIVVNGQKEKNEEEKLRKEKK